jgi:hypothetical protein
MHAPREDHGVPVILGTLERARDWVEPFAEGEWQLVSAEAGGDIE